MYQRYFSPKILHAFEGYLGIVRLLIDAGADINAVNEEGFTLVPTKMYFKKGKAKIEIAVAKGKKQFDKRHAKKTRDWNREKARLLSKNNK